MNREDVETVIHTALPLRWSKLHTLVMYHHTTDTRLHDRHSTVATCSPRCVHGMVL